VFDFPIEPCGTNVNAKSVNDMTAGMKVYRVVFLCSSRCDVCICGSSLSVSSEVLELVSSVVVYVFQDINCLDNPRLVETDSY